MLLTNLRLKGGRGQGRKETRMGVETQCCLHLDQSWPVLLLTLDSASRPRARAKSDFWTSLSTDLASIIHHSHSRRSPKEICYAPGPPGASRSPLVLLKHHVCWAPRLQRLSGGSARWLGAQALRPDRPGLATQPTSVSGVALA